MIVVDASVVAAALIDGGRGGDAARAAMAGEMLVGPALIDLEVLSVLRRLVRARRLTAESAGRAVDTLALLPIDRYAHDPLLRRCWELRGNVTTYDAAYIALAELIGTVLVTADARLARAPGIRCRVELVDA